jgi:hypothetical protein
LPVCRIDLNARVEDGQLDRRPIGLKHIDIHNVIAREIWASVLRGPPRLPPLCSLRPRLLAASFQTVPPTFSSMPVTTVLNPMTHAGVPGQAAGRRQQPLRTTEVSVRDWVLVPTRTRALSFVAYRKHP